VDKFFFTTLAKLVSCSVFSLAKSETVQLAKNMKRIRGSEKKKQQKQTRQSGFVFLLVNPEFYSHLASM
jgi:hypothetical protein